MFQVHFGGLNCILGNNWLRLSFGKKNHNKTHKNLAYGRLYITQENQWS